MGSKTLLVLALLGLGQLANAADCDIFLAKIENRVFSSCAVSIDGKPESDFTEFSIASSSGMTFSNGNITEHATYYHFVLSVKDGAARGFSGFTSGFDERAQNFLGAPSHNTCSDERSLFYVINHGGEVSGSGQIALSPDGKGIQASISRAGKPELNVNCTSSEVKK